MRISQFSYAMVVGLLTCGTLARAQSTTQECPPGAWFCEEAPDSAPPQELSPPAPTPPPPAAENKQAPTTIVVPGAQASQPIVVYQQTPPPPPRVVLVRRPAAPFPVPPPPPPKKRERYRPWGFNLHIAGVLMDNESNESTGMGGAGIALRLRPERFVAIDVGLDMLGGRDYQGYRRSELPFSLSALLYANPRDATQFYVLGGLDWSAAHVKIQERSNESVDYSYFGLHTGLGLEFRLSHPVALNLDLLGFIRTRTDSLASTNPEFTDPDTGQTTNSSGGGLLRAGLTFYW